MRSAGLGAIADDSSCWARSVLSPSLRPLPHRSARLPRRQRAGAAPTYARPNTVTRIDPATSRVSAVIDVGVSPAAVAAAGSSVWTYNQPDRSVSEIDARTNTLRLTTTPVSPRAQDVSEFAGPVLAARTGEACHRPRSLQAIASHADPVRWRETRVPARPLPESSSSRFRRRLGRRTRSSRQPGVAHRSGDRRCTARTRFPVGAPIDSIMTAFGAVWLSARRRERSTGSIHARR